MDPRDRPADLGAGEPGSDPSVVARVDGEQDGPPIGQRPGRSDETGVAQKVQLPRDRWAAEPELLGQARRSPGSHRHSRHELTPSRIGDQVDPRTIPSWHVAVSGIWVSRQILPCAGRLTIDPPYARDLPGCGR